MSFYLKANNIDGSVTTKGHENSIAIESFEFGVSRYIKVRPGHVTDREDGLPNFNEVLITKTLDKASPYLFEASYTGNSLGQMKIMACGSSGSADKYLQYTLGDVIISKYDIMGNDDHESSQLPTETLRLNFTQIEMTFTPRNGDNKPLSPITTGYNIETATNL